MNLYHNATGVGPVVICMISMTLVIHNILFYDGLQTKSKIVRRLCDIRRVCCPDILRRTVPNRIHKFQKVLKLVFDGFHCQKKKLI